MVDPQVRFEELVQVLERRGCMGTAMRTISDSLMNQFNFWPGSRTHHHNWIGGLGDHVAQVYQLLIKFGSELGISIDYETAFILACLHDFPKIYRYKLAPSYNRWLVPSSNQVCRSEDVTFVKREPGMIYSEELLLGMYIGRQGIPVGGSVQNALVLSEGGWANIYKLNPRASGTTSLATLLHLADEASAKLWRNQGGSRGRRMDRDDTTISLEQARVMKESELLIHMPWRESTCRSES